MFILQHVKIVIKSSLALNGASRCLEFNRKDHKVFSAISGFNKYISEVCMPNMKYAKAKVMANQAKVIVFDSNKPKARHHKFHSMVLE